MVRRYEPGNYVMEFSPFEEIVGGRKVFTRTLSPGPGKPKEYRIIVMEGCFAVSISPRGALTAQEKDHVMDALRKNEDARTIADRYFV